MNTTTARLIATRIAELIEFTSIFQTRYGKDYEMKPGSPAEAWRLYQAIFDQQTSIAALLDVASLEIPVYRLPMWWKRQETIDNAIITQMAQEAFHLIACCASYEANPDHQPSPVILCSQRVIAGALHPSTLLLALNSLQLAS